MLCRHAVGHHLLQALALDFVLDPQGYPDMTGARHVHQIARRNRQVGGQPCALGADRILGHLHHQRLPLMDQGTDAFHGAAFAIGYLGGMDERRTFQADVDERRLHPRQYPYHRPL